ncbi:MAG: CocE/NonD family hydrolase [Acidimicrobiales bacterium]|nr:CocE/NonD family hydrolase [Acidimicrobiales bacterium]
MTTSSPPTTNCEPISAGAWCKPLGGFRGLGALIVVGGHTFFASRIYPYNGAIHFLSIIVPIFFVISSYALYRPFLEAQLNQDPQPNARYFWWKRFLRIYPLYFVALSFYLVLLPGVRPQSGRVIDYLKLYGFMQIYDPDLVRFSGIPAAWFLCDEVVFYLLIPFIAMFSVWLARRSQDRRRSARARNAVRANVKIAIGMIVIGQVSRTWLLLIDYPGATSLPVSNLDYYGLGILLAAASLAERNSMKIPSATNWLRLRPKAATAVVVIGAIGMNLIANKPGQTLSRWEDVQRYGLYSFITAPLMVVMVLGVQDRSFNRVLGSPRWNFFATLSLHLYLWHQLVLGGFDHYITEIANVDLGTRFITGLVLVTGAIATTTAWSALLRPALDAPYSRWSKLFPRPGDQPLPQWVRPASLAIGCAVLVAGVWVSITYGASPMKALGGVEMVTVTNARRGDTIVIMTTGASRKTVDKVAVDEFGSAIAREIDPGRYEVRQERGGRLVVKRMTVVKGLEDRPSADFYQSQQFSEGLNYITTRDGTKLSIYVDLPGPASKGPYPTVVELSGYRIGDDEVTQPATAIARALGYATVGVNMRGSGCSGGAFELFSPALLADGYDVVETIASQDWVSTNKVGLIGFSYGGLGALAAASSAPPSLNSVTALSIYGDARQALHPGGLSNSGFPIGWMQNLTADAKPFAPKWVQKRVQEGDTTCRNNQLLHSQAVDIVERYMRDVPLDERFDDISPSVWAKSINVPVFLAGQFQDSTIGNDLADHFANFTAAPLKKLVLTNGTHGDAIAPQVIWRMDEFLSLYVRREVPAKFDPGAILAKTRPGVDSDLVPEGPTPVTSVSDQPSFEAALSAYELTPDVEVLFESGNSAVPEAAAAAQSQGYATWPPSEARTSALYLAPDGSLGSVNSANAALARFRTNPSLAGEALNIEGSDLTTNTMSKWPQPTTGSAASWIGEPAPTNQALVGSGIVQLWVKADTPDADLQASLSMIDSAGKETQIQVGWRRISDARDQRYEPGTWTQVPIVLGPMGQIIREGTRLRLTLGTAGDTQVQWSFYPPPNGASTVQVGQGGDSPSWMVLPVIDDFKVIAKAPACGVLRGQPCRDYEPLVNNDGNS